MCPNCRRQFKVNLNGKIRSHWCQPVSGDSKAVTFATGGTLRLRLEANWMLFGDDERALLCAIIDAIHAYEEKHPSDERSESPQSAVAVDPVAQVTTD
jgi:hypothetical protein